MKVTGVPSGLRPSTGEEGRRENTQTESKTRRLLAEMALSVVRKNPQEPAQTRASRQKKANRLGLAFKVLVEAGGIEPPSASPTLQDLHAYPVYCSHHGLPDRQGKPTTSVVLFSLVLPDTRVLGDPVIATPSQPAQARRRVE